MGTDVTSNRFIQNSHHIHLQNALHPMRHHDNSPIPGLFRDNLLNPPLTLTI